MTDPTDRIDTLAAAIGITLEPGWRDGVRMNLEISLRMAAMVADFPLDDEDDALPVFTP
jgi:hypothetical protein